MVPLAAGELDDLVLDGRAVAGADALDLSRVQGRQVQVFADDAADLGGGVAQVSSSTRFFTGRRVYMEKGSGGSSPGWGVNFAQSMLSACSRIGVPVFRRRISKPRSRMFSASCREGGSLARPAA